MTKTHTPLSYRYCRNTSGQFAVWMGVLALPLLMATTFAMDFYSAQRSATQIKAALDAAALAAVTNQNISDKERGEYATKHFNTNFKDSENFTMTVVDSSSEHVELNAVGLIPVSISGALGFEGIHVNETSAAELTRESIICVMTLNPSGERSFEVTGGSTFNSPSCAVQVNSTDKNAAVVDQASRAVAKDFCVAGGASGAYSPYANTECSAVEDPYINRTPPPSGTCVDIDKKLIKTSSKDISDDAVLYPGTYCDNLMIIGKNVTFMPGTYIMDNARFVIKNGATARADGVTIIIRGKQSAVQIMNGSSLYIKAPSEGDMAGLAFFQDKASLTDKNGKTQTTKSDLKGGSKMVIVGTVYMPYTDIRISGDSSYGTNAPATSFIGWNVGFEDKANITAKIDHASAGLPPILPRSDEGARLVQ